MIKTRLEMPLPKLGSGNLPRSEGLHITTAIRSFLDAAGLPQKIAGGWDMDAAAACGFIWEEAFSLAFRELMCDRPRPGEIKCEGIILSPDDINIPLWRLGEYKFTWTSSRREVEDNHKWMMQIKSYCYAIQTLQCELHVLYANGDYKGSGPLYVPWLLTFAPEEIAENWAMIKAHTETPPW